MSEKISIESQHEALKIAKGTQKKGQTKEQTKLIAQGIEKGISEYKKLQKVKARERDKMRKKELKHKSNSTADLVQLSSKQTSNKRELFAWFSLAASWLGFISYFLLT